MIDLFKVYMPDNLNASAINDILRSGKLTSGVYLKQFEKKLQDFIGNPYVMVTANNNYASLISLALCNIKNGDEVIASPMACLASTQPILNFGAKVVWADIDPKTGSLDPEDVKRKINSKTKAILHYHWGGYPGYIDEINELGRLHGIIVIDDAIESFGSEYKGHRMGNTGTDITTFSFQTVRLPNSIDGGAIAFKSKDVYEKAIKMRDFGITRSTFRDHLGEISPESDIADIGYNALMNEVNAFLGNYIIDDVDKLIERQRANAIIWDEYFNNSIHKLSFRSEILPNNWIYSYLSPTQMHDMSRFREQGVYASKVHLRNDHYTSFGSFNNDLLGVNYFAEHQLSVPSGWWVTKNDILKLVDGSAKS